MPADTGEAQPPEETEMKPTRINPTAATLPTRNESWGFFGTVETALESTYEAERQYEAAQRALMTLGLTAEQARDYLDSRDGRHLADAALGTCHSVLEVPWLAKSIRGFLKTYDPAAFASSLGY
jgi:hypothetical protein